MTPKKFNLRDSLLAVPHVFRLGAALYLVPLSFYLEPPGPILVLTAICGVVPSGILVLAALFSGEGGKVRKRRWLAFASEMAAAGLIFAAGFFHIDRGQRGDEVGLVYLAYAVLILLSAQLNHIPFHTETGALAENLPGNGSKNPSIRQQITALPPSAPRDPHHRESGGKVDVS